MNHPRTWICKKYMQKDLSYNWTTIKLHTQSKNMERQGIPAHTQNYLINGPQWNWINYPRTLSCKKYMHKELSYKWTTIELPDPYQSIELQQIYPPKIVV
jgi:hypothetical protein